MHERRRKKTLAGGAKGRQGRGRGPAAERSTIGHSERVEGPMLLSGRGFSAPETPFQFPNDPLAVVPT